VVINNACGVRPDWMIWIYPEDFPARRRRGLGDGQQRVEADAFVPAPGTLTAASSGVVGRWRSGWILGLHALAPQGFIAYRGCDMVYAAFGDTHFYGTGTPDPFACKDVTCAR